MKQIVSKVDQAEIKGYLRISQTQSLRPKLRLSPDSPPNRSVAGQGINVL